MKKAVNDVEILVKGGGWNRYSVWHLRFCAQDVMEVSGELTSVTKKLVDFNIKVVVRSQLITDSHDRY